MIMPATPVWAAVPVKEFTGAKQRLSGMLSADQREVLAATMLEDVLAALAGATRLAGILVNTVDPRAAALAHRHGARVIAEDAQDGHTAAVAGMAGVILREGLGALLTVPGDIPGATSAPFSGRGALSARSADAANSGRRTGRIPVCGVKCRVAFDGDCCQQHVGCVPPSQANLQRDGGAAPPHQARPTAAWARA